jgi:hypothetical protein
MGQGEQVEVGVLKSLGERSFWVFFLCDFSWEEEEKDEESW